MASCTQLRKDSWRTTSRARVRDRFSWISRRSCFTELASRGLPRRASRRSYWNWLAATSRGWTLAAVTGWPRLAARLNPRGLNFVILQPFPTECERVVIATTGVTSIWLAMASLEGELLVSRPKQLAVASCQEELLVSRYLTGEAAPLCVMLMQGLIPNQCTLPKYDLSGKVGVPLPGPK